MPLYIRDERIDELVKEVMRATGAKTKTEAVRQALRDALENDRNRPSLSDRVKPLQDRVAALGTPDPGFDMKSFTDDLWEER
ncbi:type II toxin-antitoxin system VapB family antitoxin [Jannaschia rubra]|uniref:type II toxin-antitoxin system VapB family antitoxin n=1 Tax=Jannaschia rubra TaxID=282197 RepID=UPI002491C342|nr:type II toxin-antitoxin system VapB family antitoxin [Jannaschia rubra]